MSYMSQPNTNSEAVKRCLNIPIQPMSSQIARPVPPQKPLQPKPPYALESHHNAAKPARPYSAPQRRITAPGYSEAWRSSNHVENRMPARSRSYYVNNEYPKSHPYASRQREGFVRKTLGYPEVQRGQSYPIPPYDPLGDPHLTEYFERRFGAIQSVARRRGGSRPSSAPSSRYTTTGSGKKIRADGGEGPILYKVFVTTADKKGASTDAKVFLSLKGTKAKITRTRLTKKAGSVKSNKRVSFKFSKGTTHMFKIRGPELGDIKSLVMEHDGIKKEDGWFLQEVEIVNTKRKKSWLFMCNNWLSLYHGDGHSKREFFPHLGSKTDYEIVVVTGDILNAGTDSNVFITIYGKTGATTKTHLKSVKSKLPFQQGTSNLFKIHSNCVGPLTKIKIEHDNVGFAPGWFLERVVVTDLLHPKWKYYFPCNQWLAKDEGDGAICRTLLGSRDPFAVRKDTKYKVTVYTGNKKGAGTDANVYIILFGENGDSSEKYLDDSRNNFERGQTDEFVIECPCLGRLDRLRIGHDNSGFGPGWYLDKVIVDDLDNSITYEFPCSRWLALDEDDGLIFRDLVAGVGASDAYTGKGLVKRGFPYVISVVTGDRQNAGTDANVFVVLHNGKKKLDSGKVWLSDGKFKRGMTQIFHINLQVMLSPLTSLEIGHDDSGAAPGWHCDQVIVYCPNTGIEQYFPCHKWFSTSEGDGLIQRTLYENTGLRKKKDKKNTWNVLVRTSDVKNAGTDANVGICLYGKKGKSDEIILDNKGDNFEKGQMDHFKVNIEEVGTPYKLRVYHDNTGRAAGWHLEKIELEMLGSGDRYSFVCNRWLAEDEEDRSTVREIPAKGPGIKNPLPLDKYLVQVYTGSRSMAGTDANVYINIFGERGDTGVRALRKSQNVNKFEKGKMDEFEIEAVSVLKLTKIRIGHDGKGIGAGWFLDKVVVKQVGEKKYDQEFVCQRWLAEDQDDGLIEREITASGAQMLSTTSYHIHVKTGDVSGAGTDANVYLIIYGAKGDTGQLMLRQSASFKNKFERGKTDVFKIEATDIGQIKRIKVGHDGTNIGAGWFLDDVKILVPSRGEQYVFACHRWLAKDEADGQLEIEMDASYKEDMEKTIPYEVTIWTGDKSGAGTDANVFLQIYGTDGKTETYNLRNKTDNFEKGMCDKFKIEAADIGRIQKVRIGHDGTGTFSGWYLDKMLIQRKPRKGTKKFRRRSISSARDRDRDRDSYRDRDGYRDRDRDRDSYRDRDRDRRSPIMSRMGDFSDSDDSDISSVSQSRRRRTKSPKLTKKNLKTVAEESDEYDGTETEDYWFLVDKWFARSEGDKQIVRELIPTDEKGRPIKGGLEEVTYTVRVFTGDEFGAGTDANVFVNVYGDKGDTGERQLKDSSTHTNKFERKQDSNSNLFERNQEDVFTVKAIELGKLVKLKIRHDNSGIGGAAWFLDRVEVDDPKNKKTYFFPCQRWLSTKADDGQISRELVPVDASLKNKLSRQDSKAIRNEIALETKAAMQTYYVKVTTGTVWGAGTDANVYIVLFGDNDDTGVVLLKSSRTHTNKFENGNTDEFLVEAVNIGELKKIKIGHDNKGGGGAWFLDKVAIECPSLGRNWTFPANRWLAKNKGDNQLEVELFPQDLATEEYLKCIPYEIVTYTSDVSSAGTSANVYIQLYGKEICTQQKDLCVSKLDRKDKFKRKSVDTHVLELEDVGDTIEKIRIGHDNSGMTPGWHLDKVTIRRLHESGKGSITYIFPCKRWLARDEEDNAIERELVAEKAIQEVIKNGEVQSKEVRIRDKLEKKIYTVNVKTGDKSGCGTNANVFLTVVGDRGDTGERKLAKSETNFDKFEKNQIDVFKLEAADLGRIYKIRIRHDNSGFSPAWYLDHVEIVDSSDNDTYMFHCERWLAKNKDDMKIERSFYVKGYDGEMSSTGTLRSTKYGSIASLDSLRSTDPFSKSPKLSRKQLSMEDIPEGPTIPYTVRVSTGDGEDNGTSSNVWIMILGPRKKSTGRLFLELAQKNTFARGSTEIFSIEAVDIDEVKKIEVGHDGTAPGTGWFVKQVEVDMPTKGKHYTFACRQWLARDKGDGKTSRIFSVDDGISSMSSYKPMIPYEMTVYTGDVEEAGTDQKITMTVFGEKGTTTPQVLENAGDRFERDRADFIKLELEDVAPVKKMRIECDGKGSRPDWYLEKIELRNMSTGVLSVFDCKGWLSKAKGVLSRDMPAREGRKIMVDKTNYKINVKTSNVKGAGTDANVYVTLFGDNGDSGPLHLKKSETFKDPFENDQMDVFLFNDILSLGELSKCRVWHDNKGSIPGFGAAWHLAYIEVEDIGTRKSYTFHCNKWLSKSEDDKQILRELTCSTAAKGGTPDMKDKSSYEIEVKTSDKKEGGTIHNGWIILEGKKRTSKIFRLENSATNKILRKGNVDHFTFPSAPLGELERCIVGAFEREDRPLGDAEGREAEWHCFEISVTDAAKGKKYIFPCKEWIQIKERINKRYGKSLDVKKVEESQTSIVRTLASIKYEIIVYTGDKFGAGTNANVYVTLYGEHGDTGKRALTQSMRDLFERKQVDKFTIEAVDLGKLTKIHVEHDNSGWRPKWYLDRIEVLNTVNNDLTVFPCEQWLDKDGGDCQIERDLYPKD
ncbi:lipoxygenase homology domain-containing protein 1-like isoform X6 [Mercenaria mercenaria]|uniref:lipoxygenase homology domain-containing protein 1-like isoform X6 n=1 Tax=Mercenaria mercenaria TaxID=6596 RepID=UPI00234F9A9D|nr:lipoxygenase homology domain-containing protein 1-like isoform X6 [Mercenaria mercenaria]